MKLTSFGISNFKAFGHSHQEMPLKPITLVFGPNSSGKSSLLHGLLWTAEMMDQHSFDVHLSKHVSGTLDLGGFLSVLRGHDPKNKIRISVGAGNTTSGEPVRIVLEIGIRTDTDSLEIFRREWLESHSAWDEISEFRDKWEQIDKAVSTFNQAFNWQDLSTEEVESALATDEAWDEQVERHRLNEKESGYEPEPLPTTSQARALYREAQQAWERRQELAPKIIPLLHDLHKDFRNIDKLETREAFLLSCQVQIGELQIMEANRGLGLNSLTVNPSTFASSEWEALLSQTKAADQPEDSPTASPASTTRPRTGLVSFRIAEGSGNPKLSAAIQWLTDRLHQFAEQMDALVVVGPLRALPSRRELLGFPSEIPTDPLLRPWMRLRDDYTVLKSVNDALKRLTGSHLLFCRASYGRIGRMINIEDEMPEDPLKSQDIQGLRPSPTDWNAAKFIDGHVSLSSDWLIPEEGPFYREAKDYEPELAAQLVEQYLSRKFPHEILFDLLLRDGRSGVDVKPQDVGVGISQISPVLVQAYGNRESIIAIEQPEIHIHPKLQAELGDVFIESALGPNQNTFLLETHSEHLILRILRRIRETTKGDFSDWSEELKKACPDGIGPGDVAVLYVEPGEDGAKVIELPVTHDGDFSRPWPDGFFTERAKELY